MFYMITGEYYRNKFSTEITTNMKILKGKIEAYLTPNSELIKNNCI